MIKNEDFFLALVMGMVLIISVLTPLSTTYRMSLGQAVQRTVINK